MADVAEAEAVDDAAVVAAGGVQVVMETVM